MCTIYEAMSCHVTHISDSTYISIILSVFVLQRQQDSDATAGWPVLSPSSESRVMNPESRVPVSLSSENWTMIYEALSQTSY